MNSTENLTYEGERKGLKTENANRTLPLSPALARALHEWRQQTEYPEDESPVFPSSAGMPHADIAFTQRVYVGQMDSGSGARSS